jgi:hypothetical protein
VSGNALKALGVLGQSVWYDELEKEGAAKFSASFDGLMRAIDQKHSAMRVA